jgi:hypothetical protein
MWSRFVGIFFGRRRDCRTNHPISAKLLQISILSAEGTMDVNLFKFLEEDIPDKTNVADKGKGSNIGRENLIQPRSNASDGGESDRKVNNSVSAVSFMAVLSSSGTNILRPKLRIASLGAKVDISQLDTELIKMNADAWKNVQIPSLPDVSAINPPVSAIPTEQRLSTMNTNDVNKEISNEAEMSDERNAQIDTVWSESKCGRRL